jgi:hypothetical protein
VRLHALPDSVQESWAWTPGMRHRHLHLHQEGAGRRAHGQDRWRRGTDLGQGLTERSFFDRRRTKDGCSGEEAICWAWPIWLSGEVRYDVEKTRRIPRALRRKYEKSYY